MKNKKITYIFALAIFLALTATTSFLLNGSRVVPEAQAAGKLKELIPFDLITFNGEKINIKDYLGKPIVLNFWGSWCPPCRYEAKDIESTYKTFQGRVSFVGVAVQDTESKARAFIKTYQVSYPNGIDLDEELMNTYSVFGLPMTAIFDKNGKLAYKHIGAISKAKLTKELKKLL